MAKRDKYRNKKVSDFFDYTEGKLSDRERNALERRMQKDAFESDAAEGFSGVSREEAEQDLQSFAAKISKRIGRENSSNANIEIQAGRNRRMEGAGSNTRRNRKIAWYSAAATIASLMIVTTVFFRLNDNGLERFETAPEMREAAREKAAPLQEAAKEQEAPLQEVEMEMEDPGSEELEGTDEPAMEAIDRKGPVDEGAKDQDEPMSEAAKDLDKPAGGAGEMNDEESFPVTAGPDAKKGYDLEEMLIQEKELSMDQEEALDVNYIGMKTEEVPATTNKPMEIALVPDEISLEEVVVVGHGGSKKSQLTASTTAEEVEPSGTVKFESAVPENGMADFRSYIDTTLVYPELKDVSGRKVVVLKFSVAPDGLPQNFRVIRAPDNEAFEKEAIRVVSEGPAWHPATKNGQHTEEDIRLRIVFRKD